MKDYTEYDFAAIVGAEVETTQKDGRKSSGTLKAIGRQNGAVLLYPSDKKKLVDWVLIKDILSLSAKIKVEDATLKQLKRYAEILRKRNEEKARVVFSVNQESARNEYVYFSCTLQDCPSKFITDEYRHFEDYIDCTDWGWQK